MKRKKNGNCLSKLLAALLVAACLFSLTACGENDSVSVANSHASSQQSEKQTQSVEKDESSSVAPFQERIPAAIASSAPAQARAQTASKEEWRELYKKVLLDKETFADITEGQVSLNDVDQNGVPELYISAGTIQYFELRGIYDASTGKLESNKKPGVAFGNDLYKNKITGAYALKGSSGGNGQVQAFWLVPTPNKLGFEQISGDGFSRGGFDSPSRKLHGDFDATNYEELKGAGTSLSLTGDYNTKFALPTEVEVCKLLGLETSVQTLINSKIPYIGDLEKIAMSKGQTRAFISIIETAQNQPNSRGGGRVALADGGNGIPMLWVTQADGFSLDCIWQWNGKSAEKIKFLSPQISRIELYNVNGGLYLVGSEFITSIQMTVSLAHRLNQGQMRKDYSSSIYAFFRESDLPFKDTFNSRYPGVYFDSQAFEEEFKQNGWGIYDGFNGFGRQCYDGILESKADLKSISLWKSLDEAPALITGCSSGNVDPASYTDTDKLLSMLKAYVE